jgi:hypothetical protein
MKRRISWEEQRRLIKRLIRRMDLESDIAIEDRVIGCLDWSVASVTVKEKKYKLTREEIIWAITVFIRWYKMYSKTPKKSKYEICPNKNKIFIDFYY